MAQRKVLDNDKSRNADLAAIHIAKAALGWDEDHYRDILFAKCRVRSSSQLDHASRKAFLAHLRACGWDGGAKAAPGRPAASARPARKPLTAPQRKMWSLWMQLADAKLLEKRTMAALLAFAKRTTKVERLEWLTAAQEQLVIEALKQWLARREAPQP